jgi:hypothetical protein
MKQKLLTETPVCPRECLVIISYTTGLSFAKERIGPLAAIVTTIFYLLALYLFALPNTPENPFASIYSETLIKATNQHLLFLVGFDTLIYRKYYDTPPILVGHQWEVQPLQIYVRGDGRLKLSKQSININTSTFYLLKLLFLLPFFGDFL